MISRTLLETRVTKRHQRHRRVFTIHLEGFEDPETIHLIRRLLKILGRRYGLRCLRCARKWSTRGAAVSRRAIASEIKAARRKQLPTKPRRPAAGNREED
jgi:hypothetical protein